MYSMRTILVIYAAVAIASAQAPVPSARLLNAAKEPHNWLTYSGDYSGRRHSSLRQVHAANVSQLSLQWVFQTGSSIRLQVTPLVVDGIMYITAADNKAYALDARTGRTIWRYTRALPQKISALCCGRVNRGFGILGDKLFMATIDAHVVALDAKTGNVIWETKAEDYKKGFSFTVAPLVVKDKVIVGVAGGEYGVRGFIDAYDAETGKRAWRFYTIPGAGEPGNETWAGDSWKSGGASAWLTGTYDPDLNLVYWGIGNPGPDLWGGNRKGDNLYTDSVVALDADTGKLKWYFQFTPHDVHDWDTVQIPVLADLDYEGRTRKLLLLANRNGFYYALDRTNGKFLRAKPFVRVTWAKGIRADGRPDVIPGTDPSPEGNYACPGLGGGTNWMSPSLNPQTGLMYVPFREQCDIFYSAESKYREGQLFFGGTYEDKRTERDWGGIKAIQPQTGDVKWEFKFDKPTVGGTLSTAGGLVFTGDDDGYVVALDAETGKDLWHVGLGSPITAAPMTFALDGKQYVAIAAGAGLFTFALPER